MNLQECLEVLADDHRDLKHSDLMQLSGLTTDEVRGVANMWRGIVPGRKVVLLAKLREISEDNLEADFNDLLQFCLRDDDPDVKEQAIEGLWECEDRALVTTLVELLIGDPSHAVRAKAAAALGKFATLAQTGKMLSKDGDRVKNSLVAVVQDQEEDWDVRRRAIEAVAPFNTDDVHSMIREAYFSDRTEMRYSAVYAMGKSCDVEWLPIIFSELTSDDPAMRYEASNACGELGEEPAVPYLIALFGDDDQQAQASAIAAVGAIGGELAKKALLRCLKSADDLAVEAAQAALDHVDAIEGPLSFGSDRSVNPLF